MFAEVFERWKQSCCKIVGFILTQLSIKNINKNITQDNKQSSKITKGACHVVFILEDCLLS